MPRYIDTELIPYAESEFGSFDDCAYRYDINEIPTADVVEVKHGEWVWDKRFSDYTCNLCGNWDLKTPNYCPNCGAKMDGGK